MRDKSLLDKSERWTERGLHSYYQNWPGRKRATDWISNIVPLKYAGLYKVMMNCGTLLKGLLYFHMETTRGGGVREARVRLFCGPIYFLCVCVLHSELMLGRECHWFASNRTAIMPVHNHDHHCQERETHADPVFCVSPWLLFLW